MPATLEFTVVFPSAMESAAMLELALLPMFAPVSEVRWAPVVKLTAGVEGTVLAMPMAHACVIVALCSTQHQGNASSIAMANPLLIAMGLIF